MKAPSIALSALIALLVAAPWVQAGRILPTPFALELELDSGQDYTFGQLIFKTPVFDNAPFAPPAKHAVPGFADPLGIGADQKLSVFSGVVQFMDLLGDFTLEHDKDLAAAALPPNALKGTDYRDNLLEGILTGKRRAFDPSLLNVKSGEVRELNGRPVTSETNPLSLAGFGVVSEYLKPIREHWTRCPAIEKRARVMQEVPGKLQKKFQPRPSTCFPI